MSNKELISINKNHYNYKLCVVYKEDSIKPMYTRFKENIIHFRLEVHENKYFDKVIICYISFFQNEFNKKYGS